MKTQMEYVFSQKELVEMTVGALIVKLKSLGVEADPKGISFKGVNCSGEVVFDTPNYTLNDNDALSNDYGTLENNDDCLFVRVVTVEKASAPRKRATRRRG